MEHLIDIGNGGDLLVVVEPISRSGSQSDWLFLLRRPNRKDEVLAKFARSKIRWDETTGKVWASDLSLILKLSIQERFIFLNGQLSTWYGSVFWKIEGIILQFELEHK